MSLLGSFWLYGWLILIFATFTHFFAQISCIQFMYVQLGACIVYLCRILVLHVQYHHISYQHVSILLHNNELTKVDIKKNHIISHNDFALVILPPLIHEWIWYISLTVSMLSTVTRRGRFIWFDRFLKWLMWEKRLGTPAKHVGTVYTGKADH